MAIKWLPEVNDQMFLLEDLIVHLQNAALHKIMGRRIPGRTPRDPKLPSIVKGKDGLLWIEPDKAEQLVLHEDSKSSVASG